MNASQTKREAYLKTAVNFLDSACLHAEAGDLKASATLILKALDQERRASGIGPQILQLIKPRSWYEVSILVAAFELIFGNP